MNLSKQISLLIPASINCLRIVLLLWFVFISNISLALDLSEALRAMEAKHSQWQSNEYNFLAEKTALGKGRAGLLPKISASASKIKVDENYTSFVSGYESREGGYDQKAYEIQLSQTIFDLSKWNAYQSGKVDHKIATINYLQTQQTLRNDLAQIYFNVLIAQEDYQLAQAEQKAFQSQLEKETSTVLSGAGSKLNLVEASAALHQARARLLRSKHNLEDRIGTLQAYTSLPFTPLAKLKEDRHPELSNKEEKYWVSTAINQNYDMQNVATMIIKSRFEMRRLLGLIMPKFNFIASYSKGDQTGGFQAGERDTTLYGVQLSVPIYSGGIDYYYYKEAKYVIKRLKQDQHSLRLLTVRQVQNAFRKVNSDLLYLDATKAALEASKLVMEMVNSQYEYGNKDLSDWLSAKRNYFSAYKNHQLARYESVLDQINLHALAGILSTEYLNNINGFLKKNE